MTRSVTTSCHFHAMSSPWVGQVCEFGDPGAALSLSQASTKMQSLVRQCWNRLMPFYITRHFRHEVHPVMPIAEQFERLRIAEAPHAGITQKMTLEAHEKGCDILQINRDGSKALSCGYGEQGREIKIWDLLTGKCLFNRHEDHRFLQMSSDGEKVFSTHYYIDQWYLTCLHLGARGVIWRIPLGAREKESIKNLSLSHDGTKALLQGIDGKCALWDLDIRKELSTILIKEKIEGGVKLNYDGKRAFVHLESGEIQIWNLTEGKCIYTSEGMGRCVMHRGHDGRRALMLFCHHPNPPTLVWLDLTAAAAPKAELLLHTPLWVLDMDINRDETRAITLSITEPGENTILQSWDLLTGECLHIFPDCSSPSHHQDNLRLAKINRSGKRAISLSYEGVLQLWDLQRGVCLQEIQGKDMTRYVDLQMDDYGWTAISPATNGEITVWNLAPLPEERLSSVAQAFRDRCPRAKREFEQLPNFVRHAVSGLQKSNNLTPSAIELPLPSRSMARGETPDRDGVSRTPREVAESLERYLGKTVLSEITEIFARGGGERELARAQVRFANLPEAIQRNVYTEIVRQHTNAGILPENRPTDYGQQAFQAATPKEKSTVIMAVWHKLHLAHSYTKTT